jgi:acyl carrier protein
MNAYRGDAACAASPPWVVRDDMFEPTISTAARGAPMTEWEREVAAMVIDTLGLDVGIDALAPDEPLYGGSLGLDSIDMLEIATVVSQRFGVEIRSGDARNEKIFASLRALADHVARHRAT